MLWGIVSAGLLLAYLLILGFYALGWKRLRRMDVSLPQALPVLPVTVIVPARNEASRIQSCLQSLAAQHYPQELMEVIVVDDASEDDTAAIIAAFASGDQRFRLLRLQAEAGMQAHKKRAIEAAVRQARHGWIVCTDADCTHPPDWLRHLAASASTPGMQFVAAPVAYHTRPNLLSVFQTLDFMTLQGITAASVSQRFHTMCNGANIAYAKAAFEAVDGFAGIDRQPTGDDMLLMHKIYRRYPCGVAYRLHPDATVQTEPAASWRAFWQQRIRWSSKAAFYDDRRIFWVLLLVYLFNAWLLILAIAGFWQREAWFWLATCLLVKILAEAAFLWPVARFFGKTRWMAWFPLLQPLHIVYTVVAGWLGRFGSYEWKGRTIAAPAKG